MSESVDEVTKCVNRSFGQTNVEKMWWSS